MPELTEVIEWVIKGLLGLLIFYVMVRVGTMAALKSYAEFTAQRHPVVRSPTPVTDPGD